MSHATSRAVKILNGIREHGGVKLTCCGQVLRIEPAKAQEMFDYHGADVVVDMEREMIESHSCSAVKHLSERQVSWEPK